MSERSKALAKTTRKLHKYDTALQQELQCIITGIDEAGRGSFAGPVVAAAVILDYDKPIEGVNDSKKLSEQARNELYDIIVVNARAWAVGSATPREIDKFNILEATWLAMQRAIDGLKESWTLALVDGNQPIPYISSDKQRTVVKGDGTSASIAAASILAKVTRDRMMIQYHDEYPLYDFASNKGYGTEEHRKSIINNGLCAIHRRSFCEDLAIQTRLQF